MARLVQAELVTGTMHTMTWIPAALRAEPGVVLLCRGSAKEWTAAWVGKFTKESEAGSPWQRK